jgi:hypothetical protein
MDMGLITGTITSLRFAGDIAKSFLSLQSMTEVQGKVIELQSAILSAQSSAMEANSQQLTMAEEIRTLQSKIESMKGWSEETKRYKLVEPWGNGSLVYALREAAKQNEPPHYICTKCFEDGRKSVLNPLDDVKGWCIFRCPHCKSEVRNGYRNASSAEYAVD